MQNVLVTGGAGVVGSALVPALGEFGWRASVFDVARDAREDVCVAEAVNAAAAESDGIIHMAAVSRVAWGEDDPQRCLRINVEGTRSVLQAAARAPKRPWVLFISSREVYGNPSKLPVVEDCPLAPVNTYGRSKAAGEALVSEARQAGLAAASIRLPSVFGSTNDIPQRVIPALSRRALRNESLRITDASQLCDFLHISDTVAGITALASRLAAGEKTLPTVHLATGTGTSLGDLARLIKRVANSDSTIVEEPPRPFDVRGFVGDARAARELLGWSPRVPFANGLAKLIADFKRQAA